MALVFADRVKVRSNSTGTGAFTLDETVYAHQGFDAIGDGNETYYGIVDNNGNWEIGRGTYTAPDQLSRDTVQSSSNNDELVNFPVGGKNVFVTFPASLAGNISESVASDSFKTIAVSGQSSVVADSSTDTLTLVAGSNITLTTNATTDTITINSTASGGSSFDQDLNTTNQVTFDKVTAGVVEAGTVGSLDTLDLSAFNNIEVISVGGAVNLTGTGVSVVVGFDDKTWTFNSNGSVTFPDSSVQTTAYTGPENLFDQDLNATDNVTFNSVTTGLVSTPTDTFLNLETSTTEGALNSWVFGTDGSLTFPDSTIQTTAWTGSVDNLTVSNIRVPADQAFYIRANYGTVYETSITLGQYGRIYLPGSTDYSRAVRSILTADSSLQIETGAVSYNLGSNGTVTLPDDALYYSPGSDFSIKTATTAPDPTPQIWFVENEGTSDTPVFSVSQATVGEGNVFLTWVDPTRPGTVQVKGPGILDGDTFVDVLTLDPYGDPYTATIGGENGVFTNGEFYTFQFTEQEVDSVRQWTFGTDGSLNLPGALILPTEGLTDGSPASPTALSLDKQVQILSGAENEGFYSLADGVQGQVMYFTPVNSGVYVVVANARIKNSGTSAVEIVTDYSWQVDFDSATQEPRTIAMAIFVNGAWNLTGGATD